ncbi:MAG: hypothetical protein ACI81T_000080 [Bacteroidia bacterium]
MLGGNPPILQILSCHKIIAEMGMAECIQTILFQPVAFPKYDAIDNSEF